VSAAGGIYLHIPYCATRCSYCSFVALTDDGTQSAYLRALSGEIAIVASQAAGGRWDTIYLGGGTPSLLPPPAISSLLDQVRSRFVVETGAEITLEANPDDIGAERLKGWRDAGVTRVSIGVQSLHDEELTEIGRRHDAATACRARDMTLAAGFEVSCDLMLGLPLQTQTTFLQDVGAMGRSGIDHLSLYLLESEKAPAIVSDRREKPEKYLSEDCQAELWEAACALLREAGLIHYEVSNWCRPGKSARHNVKYWTRTPTLGLGVSSHELWNQRRRANTGMTAAYIERLSRSERPTVTDREIEDEEARREAIVLGLRLADGVPSIWVDEWIARKADSHLAIDLARYEEARWLARGEGRIAFTEKGFLVSNEILCRFV
jgi:putative oxygen-independent coproporphyrinogen III oxidase